MLRWTKNILPYLIPTLLVGVYVLASEFWAQDPLASRKRACTAFEEQGVVEKPERDRCLKEFEFFKQSALISAESGVDRFYEYSNGWFDDGLADYRAFDEFLDIENPQEYKLLPDNKKLPSPIPVDADGPVESKYVVFLKITMIVADESGDWFLTGSRIFSDSDHPREIVALNLPTIPKSFVPRNNSVFDACLMLKVSVKTPCVAKIYTDYTVDLGVLSGRAKVISAVGMELKIPSRDEVIESNYAAKLSSWSEISSK